MNLKKCEYRDVSLVVQISEQLIYFRVNFGKCVLQLEYEIFQIFYFFLFSGVNTEYMKV